MDTSLHDLMRQYRSAARKLVIMEEYGSSAEEFDQQRSMCQELRREINGQCPDGSYDPRTDNIVEKV